MINSEIDHLVRLISKLPGLGLRSARRIVLHLLNNKEKEIKSLTESDFKEKTFKFKKNVQNGSVKLDEVIP